MPRRPNIRWEDGSLCFQEQHVWAMVILVRSSGWAARLYPQRSPWAGGALACTGFSGKAITWWLMGECPDVSSLCVSQIVSVYEWERKSRVQCLVGTCTRALKFGKRFWAHSLSQWLRLGSVFWRLELELGKRRRGSGPAGGHWVHPAFVYSSWGSRSSHALWSLLLGCRGGRSCGCRALTPHPDRIAVV